mgnify:FL=1
MVRETKRETADGIVIEPRIAPLIASVLTEDALIPVSDTVVWALSNRLPARDARGRFTRSDE